MPLIETSARLFFKAWEFACYAGFLTGREAACYMVPSGRRHDPVYWRHGQRSRRSRFAAFAAAKFGLCALVSISGEAGPGISAQSRPTPSVE